MQTSLRLKNAQPSPLSDPLECHLDAENDCFATAEPFSVCTNETPVTAFSTSTHGSIFMSTLPKAPLSPSSSLSIHESTVSYLPFEIWVVVQGFGGMEVNIVLSSVCNELKQICQATLAKKYRVVLERMPCTLSLARQDAVWTIRMSHEKVVVVRERQVVAVAGYDWVAKLVEWLGVLCLPGDVSPSRGSWAPLLSTSPPHLSSVSLANDFFATTLPGIDTDPPPDPVPVVRRPQHVIFNGPFLLERNVYDHHSDLIYPVESTVIKADPKSTSYLRYVEGGRREGGGGEGNSRVDCIVGKVVIFFFFVKSGQGPQP